MCDYDDYDVDEHLFEASDYNLVSELEDRDYIVLSQDEYESDMEDVKVKEKLKMDVFTKTDYKRFFCDILDKGYHIDDEEIISSIKKLIE